MAGCHCFSYYTNTIGEFFLNSTFAQMEYFKIGKIVATHGVDGKVVIKHSLGKQCEFKNTEALFIEERKDAFLPWFITLARAVNDSETLVSLEGINTKESARAFLQKEIWLAADDFNKLASATAPISLLGFEVIEDTHSLGIISEVIEQPHQVLCKIFIKGKEVWIPVHDETLKKIDKKRKQVEVSLPDGLIDVFLNS